MLYNIIKPNANRGNVMKKLVLIDGNSLINRAFYAIPPLNAPDGTPINAVYGFFNMTIKLIEDISPDYMAVAFDMRAPTFRHKRYDGYKATRKGMPDDLAVQLPLLKDLLTRAKIKCIEKEGFEADDIIGSMAKQFNAYTYIVTGDRDSLQLIDESTVVMLTKRGITETVILDEEQLKKQFDLYPFQIIDYKALSGDSSDNIPGVAGIGDKGAVKLLNDYQSLDNVYAHLDELANSVKTKLVLGKQNAYLSKELATIKTDMELGVTLQDCVYEFPFSSSVHAFCVENKFKTFLKRAELFDTIIAKRQDESQMQVETVNVFTVDDLKEIVSNAGDGAIYIADDVFLAFNDKKQYCIKLSRDLLDEGVTFTDALYALKEWLQSASEKIIFGAKDFIQKVFNSLRILPNKIVDLELMQYIADMTADYSSLYALLDFYGIGNNGIACGMIRIRNQLEEQLKSQNLTSLYYDVELPLSYVLYDMEKVGIKVDKAKLEEFSVLYSAKENELAEQIHELAGEKFNVKSPVQLGKILFEKLGIYYPLKANKNGEKKYSTSAEVLEKIKEDHPIVNLVLKYRFITKLKSTYIDALNPLIDAKGYVHTNFRQNVTTTGRLSSAEPNLQNIPVRTNEGKELRAMFVPSDGNELVTADYSQIELRLLAHFSQDEIMLSAYKRGEDVHTATASQVFEVDIDKVTPEMRRTAKTVNFGIIYGISDFGLASNIGCSRAQAKEYIDGYFKKFSGVAKYLDDSVKYAREKGYAKSLLGRTRKLPDLYSSNYQTRSFGERAAMNMPLQGTAADVIKIAMVKVFNALKGMKSKLVLQVHDELIVDADKDEVAEVKRILKENMENAVTLSVPLTVDIQSGKSWYDC